MALLEFETIPISGPTIPEGPVNLSVIWHFILSAYELKYISEWHGGGGKKDTMIMLRILKKLVTQDLCSPS